MVMIYGFGVQRYLDLLVPCLEKKTILSPKWWFNGDLPWYKIKHHFKQIQGDMDGLAFSGSTFEQAIWEFLKCVYRRYL